MAARSTDDTVDRWNLALSMLVGALFAVSWAVGGVPELLEVAVSLFLVAYLALGSYLPLKDQIPHYESLFGVPLIAYGAYEVATIGVQSIGTLFVLAGVALLASIPYRATSEEEEEDRAPQ